MDEFSGLAGALRIEWAKYNELRPDYETQFRRWTPFFQPDDWRGKSVAGCRMRHRAELFWPMKYGAASATAIDVDVQSLDVARRNLSQFAGASVLQRSAYDIGFENHFDIAFSIGGFITWSIRRPPLRRW